ncbi:hypothetical protein JZ751_002185 [Albula glossodonta]|uniref:Anaphylatoxin-like domain-containing protein n=1 Tax=Albula glossodonta TaxID=121402 RepID=A0A8T2P946_9TELE|nr:hypothetical protein JZ751_002185 [Albula glossodonta]
MALALIFIIFTMTVVFAQKPGCLITAPVRVHVGVEETVTVQLHEATKPAIVTLYFQQHQNKEMPLSQRESVTLNEENNYQAVVKLKVAPDLYKAVKKEIDDMSVHNIYLVAESTDVFERPRKAFCLLSTRKGYIFIQTSKPIYNPGETVNFRIFTLDNYMRPTDEAITLKIFNTKGLMVYKGDVLSEKILEKTITIPDVEQAGNWKIVASFTNLPMSNTSVEFEVREYVLPSFEVMIEPAKRYYVLKEESFHFKVSARYTYGKGVNGIAYVRFGIIDDQGNKTFLLGLEKQTAIQDGNAEITLRTEDLCGKAENLSVNIEGQRIYIAVTALETASGELEEAESNSVKIVTSPYTIDLSKTKKYFTPEGMFSILATTTYPDGTPAPGLRMKTTIKVVQGAGGAGETLSQEGFGNKDGEVALTFKIPHLAESLDIKVFAEGEDQDVVLSDAHVSVTAIHSDSKSYLSVEVPHIILEKGQEIEVTLRDITPPGHARPKHIYYMIFSKGRAVQLRRVQRTELTSVTLPFSYDLVPAFRVLAYYITHHQGRAGLVADSVWVDVQDICEGQILIQPFEHESKPGAKVHVTVRTDQADKVALAATDTAVYILNKQNKLIPQKMFDYMNSYDHACSMGGGRTHKSVFVDAGLTFLSNFANTPTDLSCHTMKRQKRTAHKHFQEFSAIVNQYKQPERRRCCNDGAKLNLKLSCEERHIRTRHQSTECQEAFLKCCRDASALREKIRRSKRRQSMARTFAEEEEDVINESVIHLRSYFPQTWMWVSKDVGASGVLSHTVSVPDSITTWDIQAIAISKKRGFCIAEPEQLKVFQDFFVSLKLPYSVKRNEQLEVKAVVYNYRAETLQVTVKMASVEGLCSAGGDKDKQVIEVPRNSAVPVYFTVVPLMVGKIPIHVTAYANQDVADQIKKDLMVVGEGKLVSMQKEYNVDGRGTNLLEIDVPNPADAIPDLESDAYMSLKGGPMGESAENCLNLAGVEKLISLPTGCAEQTMVKMSPAIHAMKYLDASDQWINFNAERRDEAKAMIQSGYTRVLSYMKDDGSYGAFIKTPSSVWLTAFIAKEFTRCRTIIPVDDSYIKRSISYLVSAQQSDGSFTDPNPVYDRTMQGGVGGLEGDVSLTAFVLVTMVHTEPIYLTGEETEMRAAMEKAKNYLGEKFESLQRPFAMAITAYALSMASPENPTAKQARQKLRGNAKCDTEKSTCHWETDENLRLTGERKPSNVPQAESIAVETAAYALLAALKGKDSKHAETIARWLTEQRQYGGGFRSTQDTVVALEALTEFSKEDNSVQDLNLKVELCLSRGRKETAHLTKRNALNLPAFQVPTGTQVKVNIEGIGNGTLTLVQTYRTMEKTDLYCDYYHLNVSLEGEVKYQQHTDEIDLHDYEYYEQEAAVDGAVEEEPLSRVEWFDLRTRRKRHAPAELERERELVYTVCVRQSPPQSHFFCRDLKLLS